LKIKFDDNIYYQWAGSNKENIILDISVGVLMLSICNQEVWAVDKEFRVWHSSNVESPSWYEEKVVGRMSWVSCNYDGEIYGINMDGRVVNLATAANVPRQYPKAQWSLGLTKISVAWNGDLWGILEDKGLYHLPNGSNVWTFWKANCNDVIVAPKDDTVLAYCECVLEQEVKTYCYLQ